MKVTTHTGKPRCQDTIECGEQCLRQAKFDDVKKCRQHSQVAKDKRRRRSFEMTTRRAS